MRAYAANLGAGRASGYRARLFVRRNKTTVLTLSALVVLVALLGAIWAFREAGREEDTLRAWLKEARESDDPTVQEDRLTKYLALRPGHPEAEALLAEARQYKPILKRINEAREVRRRVSELRKIGQSEAADQLASDMAAVLSGSVLPDLLALPENYAGREQIEDVRALANFLRGRRSVTLTGVPADADVHLVFPMARGSRALDWSEKRKIGTGTPETPLPLDAGSYVFVIEKGRQHLFLPVNISAASARSIRVTCPMDPAKVPEGMVLIAGGKDIEFGDLRYQSEPHRRALRPFLIDETEVTCAQYARYLNQLPKEYRDAAVPRRVIEGQEGRTDPLWDRRVDGTWTHAIEMSQHPVVGVSLVDAERYAEWAGKRLPTQEEWERAARGIDRREFPFGDTLDRDACNAATGMPSAVRAYPRDRSPFGVWDMGGNVAEWTASLGRIGLLKGGSFDLPRYRVAAASIGRRASDKPYPDVGFRCAKSID